VEYFELKAAASLEELHILRSEWHSEILRSEVPSWVTACFNMASLDQLAVFSVLECRLHGHESVWRLSST
jgi:hypothetical protein